MKDTSSEWNGINEWFLGHDSALVRLYWAGDNLSLLDESEWYVLTMIL